MCTTTYHHLKKKYLKCLTTLHSKKKVYIVQFLNLLLHLFCSLDEVPISLLRVAYWK